MTNFRCRFSLILTRSALIFLFALTLSACGGGSSSSAPVGPETSASCDTLTLEKTSVSPLSQVRIKGLAGNFRTNVENDDLDLYAVLEPLEDDSSPVLQAPLLIRGESGDLELDLVLPFNPADPFSLQNYETSFVAGNISCSNEVITLSGMPEADPAVLSRFGDTLKSLLVARSSEFGVTSWNDLQTRVSDFVENRGTVPLGLLMNLMAADSAATYLETISSLEEDEKALMASILETLDYENVLQQRLDVQLLSEPISTQMQSQRMTSAQSGLSSTVSAQNAGVCAAITGEPVNINDAFDLDHFMEEQASAADDLRGFSGDFREFGLASTPVLALASGGLAAGAGALLFIEYSLKQYDSKALPSSFSDMQVALDPGTSVPEDYENAGKELKWKNARVFAQSEGYNLSGPALDALSQAIGAARFFKGLGKSSEALDSVKGFLTDNLQNEVFNAIKNLNPEAECLEVAQATWGPIDVTSDEWSEDEVAGDAFELGARLPAFRALNLLKTGSGEVIVKTKDGKFGGKQTQWNQFVEIKRIRVSAEPGFHRVDTLGEEQRFLLQVRDTEMPEEVPSRTPLPAGVSIVGGPTPLGEGVFEVTLKTPDKKSQYPAAVEFFRAPILDPFDRRSTTIELIVDEEIILSPKQSCITEGGSLTLTAELRGFQEDKNVTWQVISGPGSLNVLTQTGLFRQASFGASTKGVAQVKVSATGQSGNEVADEATIAVGTCDAQLYISGFFGISAGAYEGFDDFSTAEDVLPIEPFPPTKPATFWQGRRETFSSPVTASGTREFSSGGNSATLNQSANGSGLAQFSDDGSGTANYIFDFSGTDECDNHPIGDTSEVDCSAVDAGSGFFSRHYVDITEPQSYLLNIDVSCDRSGDNWGVAILSAQFTRFDPQGSPTFPNGFPSSAEEATGTLLDMDTVGNICSSDNNDTFTLSRTIDLVGPATPDTEELVVLQFSLGAAAGNNHTPGSDSSDLFDGLFPSPIDFGTIPSPSEEAQTAGNYTGQTRIEASVSFIPIVP